MPASGLVVATRCVLGYTLVGCQLPLLYTFPSGPGSAIRHPRSPVSVSAVAEMEEVRLIKVPFPQKEEAKLARLCHIPTEGLRRGSQTISPGEPKIHNFHDCSLKEQKR